MERVSILSAVLLTAVTTMGDQQPYNLYKVSLTQKGYIQASSRYSASTDKVECDRHFLAPGRNCYNTGKLILLVHGARYFTRNGKILKCLAFLQYQVEIPALHDFTLCVWLKSNNLSNPHPFFSYSKHETERLVRSWLEPPSRGGGARVKLAILEHEVMSVPVDIALRQWYHLCQSWNKSFGQWALYLDGKLAADGQDWKMRDQVIPGGGDAVVGQEYTDFDKGLDDGIEGEVFGFNLLTSKPGSVSRHSHILSWLKTQVNSPVLPQSHYVENSGKEPSWWSLRPLQGLRTAVSEFSRNRNPIRWPEDTGLPWKVSGGIAYASNGRWPDNHRSHQAPRERTTETRGAGVEMNPGLQLVEKSYSQCASRRGSPVDESHLLIAWASTPVRVFGGALIKTAKPVCGDF